MADHRQKDIYDDYRESDFTRADRISTSDILVAALTLIINLNKGKRKLIDKH